MAIKFKGHSDCKQCGCSSQGPQCRCPSVLRLPALLLQAKTHQWTKAALLTCPGALRPPHPCWSFRWHAQTLLRALAPQRERAANAMHQQQPPLSARQPTNCLCPSPRASDVLPGYYPLSSGPTERGLGSQAPAGALSGAVPAPVSSKRARLSASITTQKHASLPPPRDSDSLASSSFPPGLL